LQILNFNINSEILTLLAKALSSFQIDRREESFGSTVVDVGQVTAVAKMLMH
jgi:hypothetical protein